MARKRRHKTKIGSAWIYSSRLHVIMYSLLLVATPFLLVRNFLQDAIGDITQFSMTLLGQRVPVIPAIAFILAIILLILFRAYLTKLRILAGIIVLLIIALSQQITDLYASFRFYDLQQNWHYFGYAIFAFMVYRDLAPRNIPLARIILLTYCCALLFSLRLFSEPQLQFSHMIISQIITRLNSKEHYNRNFTTGPAILSESSASLKRIIKDIF